MIFLLEKKIWLLFFIIENHHRSYSLVIQNISVLISFFLKTILLNFLKEIFLFFISLHIDELNIQDIQFCLGRQLLVDFFSVVQSGIFI